jgi:hypothetical protein
VLEATGRARLASLADDADPMVALHSIWEREKLEPGGKSELLAAFRDRLGIQPPQWWQQLLAGVMVGEGWHYLRGVDPWQLKDNSQLVRDPYEIVADPGMAGFPYDLELRDIGTGAVRWRNGVWAVGRGVLTGSGVHQIEMVVTDQLLFVFGAESHGAYAEAFRLEDGEPLFRFCTCYWFHFSEPWLR